jgi:hypothetical protein
MPSTVRAQALSRSPGNARIREKRGELKVVWFGSSVTYCPPRPLQPFQCPTLSCIMAPSFAHSGTESTGAQGVDELNVMVEVKAARALDPVFERQLLTYLKIMNLRLGLLMNFGMATMKAGIRRIAN